MTKYDLNGVHILNRYLWTRLESTGLMERYNNLIPFVPTQQEPVFSGMSAGKPFIVYTYLLSGYDANIWANVEQVTYRIFSDDERKLRNISNFLVDTCKRMDWTADDVNTWLEFEATYPADADERKFDFKYVKVAGSTGPEPYRQEGGRQDSSVTVRLAYTHSSAPEVGGNNLGMRS